MWPFKPNDWKIIHTERGTYTYVSSVTPNGVEVHTLYILLYSKSRNKYRIEIEGYRSINSHSTEEYDNCLKKQIELEKNNQ